MKYSIAMCAYNGEKFIDEQLNSFALQTVLPDEIIICDDGSTDGTVGKINAFKERSGLNVRLFVNEEKLGVTKNFEKACSLAQNAIVFFSDQDDVWNENKAEEILKVFKARADVNLVFSDANILKNGEVLSKKGIWGAFGLTKKRVRLLNKGKQINVFVQGWFCTGATVACRKSFIAVSSPFKEGFLHDQWLSFQACITKSAYALNKKLMSYRSHATQAVGLPTSVKLPKNKKFSMRLLTERVASGMATFHKQTQEYETLCRFCINAKQEKLMRKAVAFRCTREGLRKKRFAVRLFLVLIMLIMGKYYRFLARVNVKTVAVDMLAAAKE